MWKSMEVLTIPKPQEILFKLVNQLRARSVIFVCCMCSGKLKAEDRGDGRSMKGTIEDLVERGFVSDLDVAETGIQEEQILERG